MKFLRKLCRKRFVNESFSEILRKKYTSLNVLEREGSFKVKKDPEENNTKVVGK